MSKSQVFFIDFHANPSMSILAKLRKMLVKAGFENIDYEKKMTAIKIHFGEPGNMSYLRANYSAVVVDMIKRKGGLPFLTDSNTLYKGRRSNAVDHLQSAMENGFNPMATGCQVIIADGLKGTDIKEIPINKKHCKTAKIGAAIANADIIISMNHFKGHEMSGFGGALKNIGMGSGSIAGKMEMHSGAKPKVNESVCTSCGMCVKNCAHDAIHINKAKSKKAEIDYTKCTGCGQCIAVCMYGATYAPDDAANMQEKMMEYAYAVLQDKPAFHINFIMNVSPLCDCWGYNDVAIVPDIGIAASSDPVALDRACADLVNQSPIIKESCIGHHTDTEGKDRFMLVAPTINWHLGMDYAEKLGIGSQQYDLIKVN